MIQNASATCTHDQTRAALIEQIATWFARPPAAAMIAQWQSAEGLAALDAIADEFDCDAAVARLRAALTGAAADTLALDIAVAWTRLFEGVTGAPLVPLYESAYIDGQVQAGARLFGHAVDDMNELLVRFDMSVADEREPADHVSIELALYARLLRREDADGAALVRERLDRWVPTLLGRCQSNDPDGFHGAASSLLGALLQGRAEPDLQHAKEESHHAD